MIDLDTEELEYVVKTLEKRHVELLHELHRVVRYEYKLALRKEVELMERLRGKLEPMVYAARA